DSIPFVVGRADFLATSRDIAQRAVVLVADSLGTVDSLRRAARSLTLITYGDENSPTVGAVLTAELRAAGHSVTAVRLWPASGPASLDSARAALARNEYAIFAAAVRATAWRGTIALPDPVAQLINSVAGRRRTLLVSLGSPYLLSQTPHVSSYLLAWASNPVTEWAVARALTGRAAISGHLPISLPPRYPLGYGLSRPPTHPEPP
ncbi:MAG: glycoside hydrolase family 3 C-terminal domain-containing protein, partial [Gemmatimonadales bacterium]